MIRAGTLAVIVALSSLLVIPVAAQARPRVQAANPERLGTRPVQIRDRLVKRGPAARAATFGGFYRASNGEAVRVLASPLYVPDGVALQSWAEFFSRLPHGSELANVTVYLAPLAEMQGICSPEADACYIGSQRIIVLVGNVPPDGTPIEDLAAHEYGHHVANNRSNYPWKALDWGPKNWASYENVCANVGAQRLFPGNETSAYGLNPAEGWAEAYRVFARSGTTWAIVDSFFRPDAGARAAIWQDVYRPWSGYTAQTRRGSFRSRTGTRYRTYRFDAARDGAARIDLSSKGTLDADLYVYDSSGRRIAKAVADGNEETLQFTLCGQGSVSVRVVRYRGAGRYTMVFQKP